MITIFTLYDRIACFHTLKPFFDYPDQSLFTYTDSSEFCLRRDKNPILIMVRQFLKPDLVDLRLMERLRDKYRVIAFFHDDAGGGIPRAEVLPYVDLFYQKALFKDRSLYQRSLYGKELFSDYYHRSYGIEDPAPKNRAVVEDPSLLQKLRLSWNIGIGAFPKRTGLQRMSVALARTIGGKVVRLFHRPIAFPDVSLEDSSRSIDVHARIGLVSQPSLAFHRKLILEKIGGDPRFLLGEVDQSQYNRELFRSKMVLSPFGWGELCFRDFEAVLAGALLVKPDMEHLETWPNIFYPRETYLPFDWDSKTLCDSIDHYIDDVEARHRMVRQARDVYRGQVEQLTDRFSAILTEIKDLL